MNIKNVLAADAYRMVDALRDYAEILDAGYNSETMALLARHTADQIESGQRVYPGNLIAVSQTDLDIAHSAVIGVMVDRREKAEKARAEAERADAEAKRLEQLLTAFND